MTLYHDAAFFWNELHALRQLHVALGRASREHIQQWGLPETARGVIEALSAVVGKRVPRSTEVGVQ
jgi:hypothetical protein